MTKKKSIQLPILSLTMIGLLFVKLFTICIFRIVGGQQINGCSSSNEHKSGYILSAVILFRDSQFSTRLHE